MNDGGGQIWLQKKKRKNTCGGKRHVLKNMRQAVVATSPSVSVVMLRRQKSAINIIIKTNM